MQELEVSEEPFLEGGPQHETESPAEHSKQKQREPTPSTSAGIPEESQKRMATPSAPAKYSDAAAPPQRLLLHQWPPQPHFPPHQPAQLSPVCRVRKTSVLQTGSCRGKVKPGHLSIGSTSDMGSNLAATRCSSYNFRTCSGGSL